VRREKQRIRRALDAGVHAFLFRLYRGQSAERLREITRFRSRNPSLNLGGLVESCDILMRRNDIPKAVEVAEEIEVLLASGTANHRVTASAFYAAAAAYTGSGQAERAVPLLERLVGIESTEHGEASSEETEAKRRLASALSQIGDNKRASSLQSDVVQWLVSSREAYALGIAEGNLAVYQIRAGEYEAGRSTLKRSLARLDPKTEMYRDATAWLVHALELDGNFEGALDEQRNVVGMSIDLFGPEHPKTLRSMENKARLLDRLDRRDEAVELLKSVLAIRERTQGDDHPDTTRTRRGIARLTNGEGDSAL
jgi:tetratricopeptide (TPR) repeat protein